MKSTKISTEIADKFKLFFDGVTPMDLNRVMVGVPTIKHRAEMTINRFDFFPNRFIFIEPDELELYKPEIDSGWTPIIRTAFGLPETRNQILQFFKESNFDYLLMPDDEVKYKKVLVKDDIFQTVEVKEPEELSKLFKLELARMEKDHIDVLTIPNAQFLSARIEDTIMRDKSAVDYSFIVYTKRALCSNNYWYETAPETCEDLFMAKLLLADPFLKCRWSVLMRREVQHSALGTSTYGDADGHKAWQDRTNSILEQLSAKGFTSELMNQLWSSEHRPINYYLTNYRRRKTYIQSEPNWKNFIQTSVTA